MKDTMKLAIAAFALAGATQASATILTFDVAGGVGDHGTMPQSYGDNVASASQGGHSYGVGAEGFTPNVTVAYGAPGETPALWTTGYGNLANVHFNDADGDATFTITFTADAGYLVDLYGFDLASYVRAGQTIRGLTVTDLDSAVELFTQGSTFITSGASHYDLDFQTPLSGTRLALVIDLTGLGGASDDIGIDNIRFGQSLAPVTGGVPEPASWAMMLAGFGAVGFALRRRQYEAKVRFAL